MWGQLLSVAVPRSSVLIFMCRGDLWGMGTSVKLCGSIYIAAIVVLVVALSLERAIGFAGYPFLKQ